MRDFGMCVTVSLGSIWLPEGTRSCMTWGLHVRTNACPSWPVGLFLEVQPLDVGGTIGRMPA